MKNKITPPVPKNEDARLKNLCQYQIIDTPTEKAYDDITRLAASICGTPTAIISIVDANRQWFKSKVGLEIEETSREQAFCAYTILGQEVFIVPDTLKDERFAHNPLVTADPFIRFYAGVPLITSQNYALGSLATLDYVPRELQPQQIESLKALARQVVKLIELRSDLAALTKTAFKSQQRHQESKSFFRRVIVGLGLASAILAAGGFIAHDSLNNTVNNTQKLIERYKIIDNLEDINLKMQKVAIAKHRYINSPQLKYLEPYYSVKVSVKQEVTQLRAQVANNPDQQKRLALLDRLIDQKLTEVENAVNLRKQGFDAAAQSLRTEQGKYISDRLDATIQEMEAAETQLLTRASRSVQANTYNFGVVFATGIALNFLVLAIVYYFIEREINERHKVEIDLEQERDFTFTILDTIASLVIVCSAEGKIVRFNRAAEQISGYYSDEVRGKYLWDLFLPSEEVSRVKNTIQNIQSISVNSYETHWLTRNGDRRLIAWSNSQLHDQTGAIEYVLASGNDITESAEASMALQESQGRYHDLFETASDLIQSVALDGHFIYVNRAWREALGYSEAEINHISLFDIISLDYQAHCQELFGRLINGETLGAVQAEFVTKDGKNILVEGSASCKFVDGKPVATQSIFRDITHRTQTEAELQQTNERLNRSIKELEQRNHEITLLSEISDVLQACRTIEEAYTAISTFLKLMFPDVPGGIFLINSSKNVVEAVVNWGDLPMTSNTFFTPNDCWALRRGRLHFAGTLHGSLQCQHLTHPLPTASLCVPMIAQGEALGMLYLSSLESGTAIEAKQQLAVTVAEHISLALANIKLREKLENQSIRDPLTGLYNRRYMEESLDREIFRCDRKHQPLGIIMLDVDHFKRFNDTFGHEAGDSVLKELGDFLQKYVRGSDIACRYGGEEFILILPEGSLEITSKRAEQLREGIKHLNLKYRHEPLGQITLSLGVASFPEHGMSGQDVIREADAALYKAKQEGRDAVRLAP
ncbi:diguanylate cyclase [Synechocystis sp. PCC 7509]|uniref:diguanylate cyclase n=1 Tax=Synechocystis sp. PCC 7509 TaxID=927677 RepID=UPI0002ACF091|nr:diguanylate cyclase [Synechocystis sp. PCC 7509]